MLLAPIVPATVDSHRTQASGRTRTAHNHDPSLRPTNGHKSQTDVKRCLFIRDIHATPTLIYKLACPDCGRSDFPKVHGLLNHCRIKHGSDYGGHDECIQACASVLPEEERDDVLEHGTEVTAVSVSLRRLFEMAVGADVAILRGTRPVGGEDGQGQSAAVQSSSSATSLLTRTLGYHEHTPALAAFLGKNVTRRVNVHDKDEHVDVVGGVGDDAGGQTIQRAAWKMSFGERSSAPDASEESELDFTDTLANEALVPRPQIITSAMGGHGSRFHVTARLAISDWSMRIPDGKFADRLFSGAPHHSLS